MILALINSLLESDVPREVRFMRQSQPMLLGETPPASPPEAACAAFPKEPGVRYARYRHGNTAVLAKSWIADNGFAYVGLVFDHAVQADPVEEPSFTARMFENCNALVSITNMY